MSIVTGIKLSTLDGNTGFRLDGAVGNQLGRSVSNAGDVNGDGFDDVIVGALNTSLYGYSSDSSYVVFGKAGGFSATLDLSSLDGSNGFRLDGELSYSASNYSVSNAGDVNGDGFDDLIVGARLSDPGSYGYSYNNSSGVSYVVFGKASDFDSTLDLSSLDGSNGFRLDGKLAYNAVGHSVSSAGDVNGDGFDDLIVGAPDPSAQVPEDDYSRSGDIYVVFGKASGFSARLDSAGLDSSTGFRLDGVMGDHLGYSVSSAGDVNGDGFDDLIVGARLIDPYDHSKSFGASYVVFGKTSDSATTVDLPSLDGNNGFRLDGGLLAYNAVHSVSNVGDVNGDGYHDLIIASNASPSSGSPDSSYVVFGKAGGFSATLDLSSLDGSNGFRLDGELPYSTAGHSVSNAGDVNGDGFDDMIVGVPYAAPNGDRSGSSYVVFGRASGFDATMDLSNLDDSDGIRLDGVAEGDYAGASVSNAGDVNGDGFDDVVIAAHALHGYGDSSGFSYVVFGRSDFGGGNVIEGAPGGDNLTGTPAAETFEAGDGNDTMIGRGGADVFHGGAGDDHIRVSDLDFDLVDGGAGNDVLHIGGSGLNLDLASVGDKISGIETICLYGSGDNTLTLTAADLLKLSDTTDTLRVNGNDHIVGLSNDWTDGGVRVDGYYHVYTQGEAVLLVGINVTTDFVATDLA